MSKEVIFVNSSLTQGGSEKAMSLIANYCVENGIKTHMLLLRNEERTYSINPKVDCIQFEYKYDNKFYKLVKRIIMMRKIFKNTKAKTIVSFMDDINMVTIIASLGLRKKVIISERAFPLVGRSKLSKVMEKILYPMADIIVFQTDMAKKCYSNEIQKKGIVIPNAINNNLPKRNKDNIEKNIIAAGRFVRQKNFEMLIRAFSKINKIYPEYNLIIYGQGELLSEYKKLVKELEIEKKVFFPGYISNVNEKMASSEIYVSCSNYEGISNSMLEALAIGIPTISTDCPVGGAALAIENNVNGILISVEDEEALYNSINKIIADKEFASRISLEAMKIKERFSLNKIGDIWIGLLE